MCYCIGLWPNLSLEFEMSTGIGVQIFTQAGEDLDKPTEGRLAE